VGRFATVRSGQILSPEGKPVFLRGINLGNWLVPEGYMFKFDKPTSPRMIHQVLCELIGQDEAREFWRKFQDSYVTRDDIQFIRKSGFNSVRVPFNYRLFTNEAYLGATDPRGFELLDRVIGWCSEAGLWVVLDMHCAPGGQTGDNIDDSWGYPWLFESAESRTLIIDIWRRIAERYRTEEHLLGYDLMNEPIAPYFDVAKLNPLLEPLYRDIVHAIRTVDLNHLVFLGGAQWNTNFDVFGPPFDSLAVYTFHKYWCDTVQAEIQPYIDFRAKHRVPLWMGESGENKDRWIDGFRRLLERNDVGWCFWPFKKMEAPTCVLTFDRPEGYGSIVDYAESARLSFEDLRGNRPDAGIVRKVLAGFLENCSFARCRVNEGYVKALGLAPPGGSTQ
jgi:aryl-phospho-beta-D-glucosidase BglC (GH1 family)